jgi:hypothetical protein
MDLRVLQKTGNRDHKSECKLINKDSVPCRAGQRGGLAGKLPATATYTPKVSETWCQ